MSFEPDQPATHIITLTFASLGSVGKPTSRGQKSLMVTYPDIHHALSMRRDIDLLYNDGL